MFSVLFEDAPAFKMPQLSSYTPKYTILWDLRACPGEDQAGATHAISPISMKLGLFEEFTIKPRSRKRFIF